MVCKLLVTPSIVLPKVTHYIAGSVCKVNSSQLQFSLILPFPDMPPLIRCTIASRLVKGSLLRRRRRSRFYTELQTHSLWDRRH